MRELDFDLDDAGQEVVHVAVGAAAAIGDVHCGSEHLLFGLAATAKGDLAELIGLFALDPQRVQRAINHQREWLAGLDEEEVVQPVLSTRAEAALRTRRADGSGPTGPFEILYGILDDDRSGACRVLRDLGVRTEEVRRLAAYGIRHLSPDEIQTIMTALDRRGVAHQPWWGPPPTGRVQPMRVGTDGELELASSGSARVTMQGIQVAEGGFGFTLAIESRRTWLLPPRLEPLEVLVPGSEPRHAGGPDLFRLELVFADGARAANTEPRPRFSPLVPDGPRLLLLGSRTETTSVNDRRVPDRTAIVSDWWVWPVPAPGTVEVRVHWPAEAVSGLASFDGRPVVASAEGLRSAS